jgi:hypothetical protein
LQPKLKMVTLKERENPGPPLHFSNTMDPQALKIVGLLRQKPQLLFNVLSELGQVNIAAPWRRPDPDDRKNTEVVARYEPGGTIAHAVYQGTGPKFIVGIGLPGDRHTHGASSFPGNTVTAGMQEVDERLRKRGYILLGDIPKNVAGPWVVDSLGWRRWRDDGSTTITIISEGKEVNGSRVHWTITPEGTFSNVGLGTVSANVLDAKEAADDQLRELGWIVPTE